MYIYFLTFNQYLTILLHFSVEEIEKCKNRDMLEQLLAELAGEYPAFREVFLDERDIYLTNSLQAAAQAKLKPKNREGKAFDHNFPYQKYNILFFLQARYCLKMNLSVS